MEENSWRGLVLAWANRLQLTNQPAQQMIDFTDGKFFAAFMIKHLPSWKTKGQTRTETFAELEAGFREEFTACSLFNTAGAMRYMRLMIFLAKGWVYQRSTATVEMCSAR